MKKILVWLLVMMLFLTACAQPENPGVTGLDPQPDTPFPVVADPGCSLIEYDPDRQIYFSCSSLDYDIYWGMSCLPFLDILILSREPLNIETAQVDIPIQNGYSIALTECYDGNLGRIAADDSMAGGCAFPAYLYQCYWGKTWEAGEDPALSAAFGSLKPEELPQFHVYQVSILLERTVGGEETIREITLTIDGNSYPLHIGEIRLREEPELNYPIDWDMDDGGITSQNLIYASNPMLYNDGIDQICPAFDFTAAYDMELLDLYLLDTEIEILDVRLVIRSPNGTGMDFYWDRTSPVYLNAGDAVQIFVYYRDQRQTALDYRAKAWPVIEYQCALGSYSAFAECTLQRELNFYALYAMVFDGVDLESYYRDYYFPKYESWRQDYAS